MSPTRVDLIPPPTDQTVYKKRVSFNRYMPESYLKEFLKNKFPNKVQGKDWNYKVRVLSTNVTFEFRVDLLVVRERQVHSDAFGGDVDH